MIEFEFSSRRRSGTASTVAGKILVSLFFLIFFCAGVAFAWLMGRDLFKALATRRWPAVDCTIISGTIADKLPYTAVVNYRYHLNGKDFKASIVQSGHKGSDDYYNAQKILEAYPKGSHAICRVNPANPAEAVLRTPSLWNLLELLFPMVFITIGGGGILIIWRASGIRAPATTPAKTTAIPLIVIVGFFIVGLVLIGVLIPMLIRYHSAQSWIAVPCNILHSRVKTDSGDKGDTYSVEVLYRYSFNSKRYESSRYTLISFSSSGYADKQIIADRLNQNRKQVCYVNPFDPADSVLDRGSSAIYIILGIAAVITLSIGGGGIGVITRQGKNAQLTQPQPHLPASQRGQRELQAASSPMLQFIGMCIPVLFWNGIVSIFVVSIINQWKNGDREIGEALFISIFVIIGIGLILALIGKMRTLFLPGAQLIISRSPMEIGERVELRWQFPNRADRIKQLKIRVAIFDVSADPSGPLPLRKLTPSWSMDVIDTDKRTDIQSGRRTFAIPADGLPPVFKWKRIWAILVQAEMAKGPPLRQEFPVQVQAAHEMQRVGTTDAHR